MSSDQMEQIRARLERRETLRVTFYLDEQTAIDAHEEIKTINAYVTDDVPALLTALDAANARIAALESVVRGLVGGSTCESDDEMNICIYCGHEIYEYYQEWNPMRIGRRELPHAPDCPWVAARQLTSPSK